MGFMLLREKAGPGLRQLSEKVVKQPLNQTNYKIFAAKFKYFRAVGCRRDSQFSRWEFEQFNYNNAGGSHIFSVFVSGCYYLFLN